MNKLMGLILDVVESGFDSIDEGGYPMDNPNEGSNLGTELKNIWDSTKGFVNTHSKGFAIAISCICALLVLLIIIVIIKKLQCKRKGYYRYRR